MFIVSFPSSHRDKYIHYMWNNYKRNLFIRQTLTLQLYHLIDFFILPPSLTSHKLEYTVYGIWLDNPGKL